MYDNWRVKWKPSIVILPLAEQMGQTIKKIKNKIKGTKKTSEECVKKCVKIIPCMASLASFFRKLNKIKDRWK